MSDSRDATVAITATTGQCCCTKDPERLSRTERTFWLILLQVKPRTRKIRVGHARRGTHRVITRNTITRRSHPRDDRSSCAHHYIHGAHSFGHSLITRTSGDSYNVKAHQLQAVHHQRPSVTNTIVGLSCALQAIRGMHSLAIC